MAKIQNSQIAPMNIHYIFYPLEYFLDSLVKFNVESIELWGGSPHVPIEDLSFSQVKNIGKEIERRDLKVACFTPETCVYPINIAAKEDYIRDRSVNYALKSLDIASELGTNLMQIVCGMGYYNEPIDEAWSRSRDSLERIAKKAESLGINLTLEPLLPDETNLVNNLDRAIKMLDEVGSSNLGCNLDTVPMVVAGNTIEDYFSNLGNRVNHIHLCDGPHAHVAWGDGTLPLKQYLDQLSSYDYKGYLGLEIYDSKYYIDPDQALKQSLDRIREAMA
jgi:fructoselysine 3-epimerase